MIRVAITSAACEAISATPPVRSVGYERGAGEKGLARHMGGRGGSKLYYYDNM